MTEYNLTIIIPHFNIPTLLSKLLDSIPLERDDIQVIVVDDNSTKNKEQYCKLKKKPQYRNVEFYRNNTEKNSAGTCRNIGLDHAKGKWILFADSDDFFVENWYEIIREYFNSDYEMVYFVPTSVVLTTGEKGSRHCIYEERQINYLETGSTKAEMQLRYDYHVVWSILYRRNFLEKNEIRFDNVKYSNDVFFAMLCGYYVKSFCCAMKTIYCLTLRENSLMTGKSKENYFTRKEVTIRRDAFLYHHLSCEQIHQLGILCGDFLPVLDLIDVLKSPYGNARNFILCWRKMRQAGLPLINWRFLFIHPVRFFADVVRSFKR